VICWDCRRTICRALRPQPRAVPLPLGTSVLTDCYHRTIDPSGRAGDTAPALEENAAPVALVFGPLKRRAALPTLLYPPSPHARAAGPPPAAHFFASQNLRVVSVCVNYENLLDIGASQDYMQVNPVVGWCLGFGRVIHHSNAHALPDLHWLGGVPFGRYMSVIHPRFVRPKATPFRHLAWHVKLPVFHRASRKSQEFMGPDLALESSKSPVINFLTIHAFAV